MDKLTHSLNDLSVSKPAGSDKVGQTLTYKAVEGRKFQQTLNHKAHMYADTFLSNLCSLWKSGTFCDVSIIIEGQSLSAHRHVLAAASPFFMAMFTSGMAEQEQDEIQMHEIDIEIFKVALLFMYTGRVEVTADNCVDLLSLSDMLGLSDVMEACCMFMSSQLDIENCIGVYRLAEAHCCHELKHTAEGFLHTHFLQVKHTDEFLALPKDNLIHLLSSEFLKVEDEYQVFEAAMKWIKHDLPTRRRFFFDIMSPVRLSIIPTQQMDTYIEDCTDISLKVALQKLLQDVRLDNKISRELQLARLKCSYVQPRRSARKNIYVIGGYTRGKGARWSDIQTLVTVERFDTFHKQWHIMPCMTDARSGHGMAVLNGQIYVVGGENDSLISDTMESFNPVSETWSTEANLNFPRCGLGLCEFKGCLYAFGGWIGTEIGNSFEKFDPKAGVWAIVGKMETPRFAMGVVEHQGLIYVLGGFSDPGTGLKLCHQYNPVTGEWEKLLSMHTRRAYVGVAAMDGCLYAVGGWNEHEGSMNTVEKYCIATDSWTAVPNMNVRRVGPCVAAINSILYVIGGRTFSNTHSPPVTLNSMECYNPFTDTWTEVSTMPTSRCEAGVAVI